MNNLNVICPLICEVWVITRGTNKLDDTKVRSAAGCRAGTGLGARSSGSRAPGAARRPRALTVVPVAAEELVEPDEVWPAPEVAALDDQHLLDQAEVVDDDAGLAAQVDAEHPAVDPAEGGEGLEGRPVAADQVEAAD